MTYLEEQRTQRLAALVGKWIVIADNSRIPGNVLYLQDMSLVKPTDSKVSQWTRFMVNAMAFDTEKEAREQAAKFRFGRPRVAQV